ncbi:izumo sperm-egg fusion protein 2 isoform X2 [Engystomops pustulosus]|uniref:izumo sperm-egg fusion protein 2 isoform X2 n=1 Tax=Engystomops pustulosus TaxID=76066 RepID=UPI003AFB6CDF
MAVSVTLLLVASVITMASSCYQCNTKIEKLFKKIKKDVLPKHVRDHHLLIRCEELFKGMSGNFYKDYAVKHFTGLIEIQHYNSLADYFYAEAQKLLHTKEKEQDLLDNIVKFRYETTMKLKHDLKSYRDKACSSFECGWLKAQVYSCSKCKKVNPLCLSYKVCKGKDEKRLSLTFSQKMKAATLSSAIYTLAISALILLGVAVLD